MRLSLLEIRVKTMKNFLNNYVGFILSRNVTTIYIEHGAKPPKSRRSSQPIPAVYRTRKEDRILFGPLRRKTRNTSERSTVGSRKTSSDSIDSELSWHIKHAKRSIKLRMIQEPKESTVTQENDTENSPVPEIKAETVKSKETKKEKKVIAEQDKQEKEENALETKKISNEPDSSSTVTARLLDVVVNNIMHFPIFNVKKALPTKLHDSSSSSNEDLVAKNYPSVTKILSATLSPESQSALAAWKAGLIEEMGEEKFNEFQQEQLRSGTQFHSCIEASLQGKKVDVPDNIKPAYDSLSDIMKEIKDVTAIETSVAHKHLYYKGKVDCIASYRGELCVIDWKKTTKDKRSINFMYDAPIQIAAYVGAINYSEKYPFTIKSGLIAVGYTNGQPAKVFVVSDTMLTLYWKKWLERLQLYWTLITKNNE